MNGLRNVAKPLKRIANSHGRCGTHWLKGLVSDAMGFPANGRYQARLLTTESLQDALANDAMRIFICEEFRFPLHGALLDPRTDPSLRLIVLHRHPLDRFISAVYYQCHVNGLMQKHDPDLDTAEFARRLLLGEYDEIRGECYADVFTAFQHASVVDWLERGGCLEVRYEDLVENTVDEFLRCLDHLELSVQLAEVKRIVEANRYEVFSSGRKRGDFDPTKHCRQGLSGEWKKVFRTEDTPLLRAKFGDLFARQGYPI